MRAKARLTGGEGFVIEGRKTLSGEFETNLCVVMAVLASSSRDHGNRHEPLISRDLAGIREVKNRHGYPLENAWWISKPF